MLDKTLLAPLRDRYVHAVLLGESDFAQSLIDEAVERGATTPQIYAHILAPSQTRLGELWHQGAINVAQEHLATAITLQIMDLQRHTANLQTPLGLRAVATPVEGDQHIIGARMIADLLIMEGWDVDFFWNATPAQDLAEYVQQRRTHLVALSCTMPSLLQNVKATSDALRADSAQNPKILLGGAALDNSTHQPHELGVQAIVTNLFDATSQALNLVGGEDRKPTLEQQLVSLGGRIRAARAHRKLTQQQLADASGIDRTYVSLVEHGKQNLTVGAMLKIAQALDIPISKLLEPNTVGA